MISDGVFDMSTNPSQYMLEVGGRAVSLGEREVAVRPMGESVEIVLDFGDGGGRRLLIVGLEEGFVDRLEQMAEAAKPLFGEFCVWRACRVRSLRHSEYSFRVDVVECAVAAGEPLADYVARVGEVLIGQLYRAISLFEDDLRACDCAFASLAGGDVVMGEDGALHAATLRGFSVGCGDVSYRCCDDLRRWVAEASGRAMPSWVRVCDDKEDVLCRRPLIEGYSWCGSPHEERIAVRDERGCYGFVDMEGCVVVEPQFRSVTSFAEGRAVVESRRGYGLIDRQGRFVIEDCYDDMSYSVSNGVTVAKREGLWGRFDYRGELISDFSAQYPADDILKSKNNV